MTTHENEITKDFDLIPNFNHLKQCLYFIVDFKSLSILPPFLAQNDEEAVRNFTNLTNYSQSTLCRFPEDFKLYKLGDYTVAITGSYDAAREELTKYVQQFDFIASADLLKQPDTIKYDDLNKKVSSALEQVSNTNNVLLEQIGNVPNLEKSINLITSKLQSLADEFEHFKKDECIVPPERQNFIDKLFN